MKRLAFVLLLLLLSACGDVAHGSSTRPQASVCVDTGLTGAALQENTRFCSTNRLTNLPTDCCGSVYQQAIHLAQQKGIVVGTPEYLQQSVSTGPTHVPITIVQFNSTFFAWHYDPSNGIATIEDSYGHIVYSGR